MKEVLHRAVIDVCPKTLTQTRQTRQTRQTQTGDLHVQKYSDKDSCTKHKDRQWILTNTKTQKNTKTQMETQKSTKRQIEIK